jgi:hypothetical protein
MRNLVPHRFKFAPAPYLKGICYPHQTNSRSIEGSMGLVSRSVTSPYPRPRRLENRFNRRAASAESCSSTGVRRVDIGACSTGPATAACMCLASGATAPWAGPLCAFDDAEAEESAFLPVTADSALAVVPDSRLRDISGGSWTPGIPRPQGADSAILIFLQVYERWGERRVDWPR